MVIAAKHRRPTRYPVPPHPVPRVSRATREADAGWELLEMIDGYPPDVGRYYPFWVGPVRLLLQLARFRALDREVVLAQGVTIALPKDQDESGLGA